MTLVMKKFTTRLSWKPKPNRKPRFFLQNLPKPTDRKHFETVTTLDTTITEQFGSVLFKGTQHRHTYTHIYPVTATIPGECGMACCPVIFSSHVAKENLCRYLAQDFTSWVALLSPNWQYQSMEDSKQWPHTGKTHPLDWSFHEPPTDSWWRRSSNSINFVFPTPVPWRHSTKFISIYYVHTVSSLQLAGSKGIYKNKLVAKGRSKRTP